MNKGEVWFVEFPLEEEPTRFLNRPVVVLDENLLGVLSVKITKHKARKKIRTTFPLSIGKKLICDWRQQLEFPR